MLPHSCFNYPALRFFAAIEAGSPLMEDQVWKQTILQVLNGYLDPASD